MLVPFLVHISIQLNRTFYSVLFLYLYIKRGDIIYALTPQSNWGRQVLDENLCKVWPILLLQLQLLEGLVASLLTLLSTTTTIFKSLCLSQRLLVLQRILKNLLFLLLILVILLLLFDKFLFFLKIITRPTLSN